jgi:putative transposase
VEALNRSLRNIIKTVAAFQIDGATLKLLYTFSKVLVCAGGRVVVWTTAIGQFAIQFGDRFLGAAK